MNLTLTDWITIVCFILIVVFVISPLIFILYIHFVDRKQNQHSVLRNFPVLGKVRYLFEKVGPEFRQYLFDQDTEGKPFSRVDYRDIVMPAKYHNNMISYGSKRDFDQNGYYVRNAMFPKQKDELRVDNSQLIDIKKYKIDDETLFVRKETMIEEKVKPWLLDDQDAIVIGPNCPQPFKVKSLIGMSGMSYGALGENAISALSLGLGQAGGTWMNTGEGGLSHYHMRGDVDIIMQIGPGLFGVRTKDGQFDWDALKEKASIDQVKAFELKLAQGAKARGGHLDGSKVSPEIADIRGLEPYKTVDSPNRFHEFNSVEGMIEFIEKIRSHTGKPVGMKIVVSGEDAVEELASYMKESGKSPDFITVDGGEGGTGATYQELADGVGLPVKSAISIVDRTLKRYGVRDQVKLIASGKLFTPDRVAVALALGADMVNIARAFMITVGCIMAQTCHTNTCPVGVATTDEKLQRGLVVDEKKYRVTNFVLTMRQGLFNLAAAAGLESPALFSEKHVVYKDEKGRTYSLEQLYSTTSHDYNIQSKPS